MNLSQMENGANNFSIVFDGLTKKFGEKIAVSNLTFNVPRGAIFGFLGPNGAGKTTTLKAISGVLHAE